MKEFFLKSARIGFSIWNENDMSDALELWGNPEVTKFIVVEGNMSEKQVRQRLRKEIERNTESAQLLKKLQFTYTHNEYYPPAKLYHPSYLIKKQNYTDIH